MMVSMSSVLYVPKLMIALFVLLTCDGIEETCH